MSRIDDLLTEHCPNGVPYVPLGELVVIKNGRDYKHLGDGDIPVYGSGGVMTHVDTSAHPGPSVLIPRKGSLNNIFYVDKPFWTVDTIFYTEIGKHIDGKYLYYFLVKSRLGEMNQAGGVPSQTQAALKKIGVPLPPLDVQREIVKVLDQFTELQVELKAELDARAIQYAHYRDTLMDFPEATQRVELGDLGSIFGGLTGKSKADFSGGNARFVSYVNVFKNVAVDICMNDFVRVAPGERQKQLQRGDILFTGSSETPDEVGMTSVVTVAVNEPLYLNSFCIGFRPSDPDVLDPNFTKHLFRSGGMRKQIVRTASGVTRFNVSKARLTKVVVPIPPLVEQRRIAALLDSFEAIVNNPDSGLPAEIRARRKQYEHYRDRLLTFEEAAV